MIGNSTCPIILDEPNGLNKSICKGTRPKDPNDSNDPKDPKVFKGLKGLQIYLNLF